MIRQRALRIVLVLVGLIFVAGIYPLITSVHDGWQANKQDAMPMGISLYVMMGIFLLVAARNPAAHRGVIVFGGWLNIAHAAVMTVMAVHLPNEREDMMFRQLSGNSYFPTAAKVYGDPLIRVLCREGILFDCVHSTLPGALI